MPYITRTIECDLSLVHQHHLSLEYYYTADEGVVLCSAQVYNGEGLQSRNVDLDKLSPKVFQELEGICFMHYEEHGWDKGEIMADYGGNR